MFYGGHCPKTIHTKLVCVHRTPIKGVLQDGGALRMEQDQRKERSPRFSVEGVYQRVIIGRNLFLENFYFSALDLLISKGT